MDDPHYRWLRNIAVVLTLAWVGWSFYDGFLRTSPPGQAEYHAGNRYFEDGEYTKALREYSTASSLNPGHLSAMRGQARSLMQLGRHAEALHIFDTVIEQEPGFAASYANRGILHDRMGNYQAAIADYEKAVALDPELADGPNWLTRFLRLQVEKPPTIADRALYLREQLAKMESERVMRNPEKDQQQRSYKM